MTTNIELARQVASKVEAVSSVTLKSVNLDSKIDSEALPERLALLNGYRCAHDASALLEHRILKVLVEFSFKAKFVASAEEGDEEGEDALTLNAEYVVAYRLQAGEDLSPSCIDHFSQTNGPYTLWPYWRELVQTATGRVGLSSIVMPVFRPPVVEVEEPDACI